MQHIAVGLRFVASSIPPKDEHADVGRAHYGLTQQIHAVVKVLLSVRAVNHVEFFRRELLLVIVPGEPDAYGIL